MRVKFRYPCSVLAPVPVLQVGEGLGGVDAVGPAAGVGEGAVLAGAVVTDGVRANDLAAGGDLDHVSKDRDLDLPSSMLASDFVAGASEADRPTGVDLASDGLADGRLPRS